MNESTATAREIFCPCEFLLPDTPEPGLWGAVACDQYTSEPKYWQRVYELTGGKPSAAHLILPELYLEAPDVKRRVRGIHKTMEKYLDNGVLSPAGAGFIYTERTLSGGRVRRGLLGMVDLEAYDYAPGSVSPVRATEKTVTERIPPRLMVRRGAPIELPHILLLIDDREKTVIEPFSKKKPLMKKLYDFPLMQGGGRVCGYLAGKKEEERASAALSRLAGRKRFEKLYETAEHATLVIAVGDGNHSLAAAKAGYEEIKASLPREAALRHPARYAMAELVNLQDKSLLFEPIHRVMFGVDPENVLKELGRFAGGADTRPVECVFAGGREIIHIQSPCSKSAVGALQIFLDSYAAKHGCKIDYIHGQNVVEELANDPKNIGFLLSPMEKNQLFQTIIFDGVLPRKTFSMGNAEDKRFYVEARKIR